MKADAVVNRYITSAILDLDAFVFSPPPDGSTPHAPRAISQRYRRMAIKLKLRSTRIHSLRHYSATELIAAGIDLRTVAGRLGHGSGGATTLKVYVAWVDEADRRAATTMANIMPRPVAAQQPRGLYEKIAASLRDDIRGHCCIEPQDVPAVARSSKTGSISPVDNYDKPGI